MRLFFAILLFTALAAPATAKPPLRDVAYVDDGLMAVAIADEIRKRCDGISARMVRAMSTLQDLRNHARGLGYSDDDIEAYVTSDAEKKRMKRKAKAFLQTQGVTLRDTRQLCRFGRAQIADGSSIGRLLR